jgi:hypothetical protein
MFASERIISLCVLGLILLLTAAALTMPKDVSSVSARQSPPARSTLANRVASQLRDVIVSTNRVLWSTVPLFGRVTGRLTQVLGLPQQWAMFSEPTHPQRYVKMAFELAPSRGPRSRSQRTEVTEELIFPPIRTDEAKPLLSQAFHRMKAVEGSIQDFRELGSKPEMLAPLARYFRAEFCRRSGTPCERVIRTEIWAGAISGSGDGSLAPDRWNPDRNEAIVDYFNGPKLQFRSEEPRLKAAVTESGVVWSLYYVEKSDGPEPSAP